MPATIKIVLFEDTEATRTEILAALQKHLVGRGEAKAFAGRLARKAVASAAKRLAVLICSYAREPDTEDYEWQGRWEEGHIVLRFSEGAEEVARRAVLAATGVSEIA